MATEYWLSSTVVPSNAHISTSFFRKQCFSLKYVLVAPLKIFGDLSKIGIYVILTSSVQYLTVTLKKATFRRGRSYLHLAKLRHTEGFTNVNAFIQVCLTSTLFC